MKKHIDRAIDRALKKIDRRQFLLGAVGVRSDGAIVTAYNGAVREGKLLQAHAEARLSKKLDLGSVVFVVRVNRKRQWRLAKPCAGCRAILKNKGVVSVYFTVKPNEIGTIRRGEL